MQEEGKILDSRYILSFRASQATKMCTKRAKKDSVVKGTNAQFFTGCRAIGCVSCNECRKTWFVYVRQNVINEKVTHDKIMEEIKRYCKTTAYLCGFPIINDINHPLNDRVFAQEKLCCRALIPKHYYSKLIKKYLVPLLCLICGMAENLETNPPDVNGYKTRAMCLLCVDKLKLKEREGGIQHIHYGKCMAR